jgi:hypothetical protein
MKPWYECPHHFFQTLEVIPTNWYAYQELRRGNMSSTVLQENFTITFPFVHENPNIDTKLKKIRGLIFIKEPEVELMTEDQQQNRQIVK